MVRTGNILYKLSARSLKAPAYKLALAPRGESCVGQVYVSKTLFQELRGWVGIIEANDRGLKTKTGEISPAFIQVRLASGQLTKVYVTKNELEAIGRDFALPLEVIKNNYFRLGCSPAGGQMLLIINREELLQPAWKKSLVNWVEAKGRIPSPTVFPWQLSFDEKINFPGLPQLIIFGDNKHQLRGTFELKEDGRERLAYFCYGRQKIAGYSLSSDGIHRLTNVSSTADTYSKMVLQKLFVSTEQGATYCFHKTATQNRLPLGTFNAFSMHLNGSRDTTFNEGQVYYVEAKRSNPNEVTFDVYARPGKKIIGTGQIHLQEGFPLSNSVTIRKPEE